MQTATGPAVPAPVEVRSLRKVFGGVVAVDGIDLSLAAGSIVALLGGNGAGKTTTISTIMGLIVPTSGVALVFGEDMARHRHRVLHRVNFASPYVEVPKRLTVAENLEVFARLYGVAERRRRIVELVEDFRIGELVKRPFGALSAGQRTRVSLAKALLNAPELLVLDEPTASLDPETASWIRERIGRYAREQKASVILASHNMREVEQLADRVVMLQKGRIIADETPAGLVERFGRRDLEEAFLAIVRSEAAKEPGSSSEGAP